MCVGVCMFSISILIVSLFQIEYYNTEHFLDNTLFFLLDKERPKK